MKTNLDMSLSYKAIDVYENASACKKLTCFGACLFGKILMPWGIWLIKMAVIPGEAPQGCFCLAQSAFQALR